MYNSFKTEHFVYKSQRIPYQTHSYDIAVFHFLAVKFNMKVSSGTSGHRCYADHRIDGQWERLLKVRERSFFGLFYTI